MFVFLSPGVDVAAAVEGLGRKLGYTADAGKYVSVSLGQGQEPIAMNHLNNFHRNGGWVLLQNIHLTIDWTSGPLEKKVLFPTFALHAALHVARARALLPKERKELVHSCASASDDRPRQELLLNASSPGPASTRLLAHVEAGTSPCGTVGRQAS